MPAKTVYYASVGPALTLYDIDVETAALTRRGSVTLPANIQYAWPRPSKRFLYVVSSNGGAGIAGDKHFASALAIDPASGALRLQGDPAPLPSRPIHASVDACGDFLLIAYNNPSNLTVHRLNADGTVGAPGAAPQQTPPRRFPPPGFSPRPGQPRGDPGDARQPRGSRQAGRSGRT